MIEGADMLFITAGMGGGTGTGAAPIVAEIAREMGVLTVAVVTKPFAFEGKRQKVALVGIEALKQHVDSLIIIPNDRLIEVMGDDVSYEEAFSASNDVLNGAVAGIAEVINCPGMVNVDFADVRTVMSENGVAMMGSAMASGAERSQTAAEQAVHSPLLEDIHLSGARGVLVNITASKTLKLKEVHEVMNTIRSFCAEDATVIYGNVIDDAMEDRLRVTIVATGLGGGRRAAPAAGHAGRAAQRHRRHVARPGQLRGARPADRDPPPPRRDHRRDEAIRRGHARHPGVPAQASRLTGRRRPGGGRPGLQQQRDRRVSRRSRASPSRARPAAGPC